MTTSRRSFVTILCTVLIIVSGTFGYLDDKRNITGMHGTAVEFDPRVSILDAENRFRYNAADILPLVSKVATKFFKLLVQLSPLDVDTDLPTSLSQSPLAVAEYNKLPSTTQKLEVWLSYGVMAQDHRYQDDFLYHREPILLVNHMLKLANDANNIFNNTVTTILLPYKLVLNHIHDFLNNHPFTNSTIKFGVLVIAGTFYLDISFRDHIQGLRPDIIITVLRPFSFETELLHEFSIALRDIYKFTDIEDWMTVGFFVTIPDTDMHGGVNVSSFVSTWEHAIKFCQENGTHLVLSKAFDTPYGSTINRKTSGWWRLDENSSYKSTTDYQYQDKGLIATEFKEGKENLKVSTLPITFNKAYTKIIFSLYDIKRADNLRAWFPEEMNSLLKKVVTHFSKVVVLIHDDSLGGLRGFLYEMECLGRVLGELEITIVILPHIKVREWVTGSPNLKVSDTHLENFRKRMSAVKSFIISFEGNSTIETGKDLTKFVNGNLPELVYDFGYAFNVSMCTSIGIMSQGERATVENVLRSNNVKQLMFYFEEQEETVKLGTIRMFKQRVVLMEQCRKIVKERNLKSANISFMMLHYSTDSEFYTRKLAIINFMEYWKMLNDWARETKTTVIFSNAIDVHRVFKERKLLLPELGWWRYQDLNAEGGQSSPKNDKFWVDKIEDLKLRFPELSESSSVLQRYELVIVVLLPLIFSVILAIVVYQVYIIRRNKQEIYMTKLELEQFFNGRQLMPSELGIAGNAIYTVPYNKEKYEIDANLFTIRDELGCGECGRVYSGIIPINDGTVDVAIKTVNPVNITKTTISGFLSEIKVLSHIGKHENIVELLGANTQHIKMGNVMIFLELCELGSLKDYLHKMRPEVEDVDQVHFKEMLNQTKSTVDFPKNKFVNLVAMKKLTLDPDLCNHMYRWSVEICSGMAHLARKHVVHADLATRNVLLNSYKTAKICDFGLSRRMYNYTNYVKQQQEPLPWKWMSPESLRMLQFSEKSDVWAYGVTLWEIYTLGDHPYPGLSWSLGFVDMLEGGLRLSEPKYNARNMYQLMKECWRANPHNRPSFRDLLASLTDSE